MRATRIIFRRELGAYLRSPFTWVIAAMLLLVEGILFQTQALTGEQLSAVVLEKFFWTSSLVAIIAGILLSFRLISEDRQTHSLVLLSTSPVRDVEIVLGKFLAAFVFLVILFALSIYMPILIKVEGKITTSQVLVGYIGLLSLGAASLAIGLFASALAKQQLVAGVLAAVIATLMVLLFPLAKRLDAPVRPVLQEMDLWWIHFQNGFQRGVLHLKDLVYYLAVIYFFLLLAVKALEAKRWE